MSRCSSALVCAFSHLLPASADDLLLNSSTGLICRVSVLEFSSSLLMAPHGASDGRCLLLVMAFVSCVSPVCLDASVRASLCVKSSRGHVGLGGRCPPVRWDSHRFFRLVLVLPFVQGPLGAGLPGPLFS